MEPAHISDAPIQRYVRIDRRIDQTESGTQDEAKDRNHQPLGGHRNSQEANGRERTARHDQGGPTEARTERSTAGTSREIGSGDRRENEAQAGEWCPEGRPHRGPSNADRARSEAEDHEQPRGRSGSRQALDTAGLRRNGLDHRRIIANEMPRVSSSTAMDPYARLKEGTKWMWALGDYGDLARFLEPGAEALANLAGIRPGMEVLDVAAGNGNFALVAARRGARVTASDLTPRMVELGVARTLADGLTIKWVTADAEQLPFPDGRFDTVASVFGAMFAPRPERVGAELFRVVKTGGTVAMANYARQGFLGTFAELLTRFSSQPPGDIALPSPFEWGDPAHVRQRFNGRASSLRLESRTLRFSFPSLETGWEFWERTNPPLLALRTMLPPERYRDLQAAGVAVMRDLNRDQHGGLALDSEYLAVVARKAS